MSRKLTNAPVYFTIMQVRFNPIMALDSYASAIQESFRTGGYPDAEKSALATFSFNMGQPTDVALPQVPVAQTTRYVFRNMERTAGFILDQGALSYQTTEYDVFETFSAQFLSGLLKVHKVVELSYTDRIGFRYLNAVFPKADEGGLPDYLNPWVLGLFGRLEGQLVHSFVETVLKMSDTRITARTIIQDGGVSFPPDLLPMQLMLPERFQVLRGTHAILDMDGSQEVREPISLDRVQARLAAIHNEIGKSFTATVTENAMRGWA